LVMGDPRWGVEGRVHRCLGLLGSYGANAQEYLPLLGKMREETTVNLLALRARRKTSRPDDDNLLKAINACIARVENPEDKPELIGLEDFIARHSDSR